MSCSSTKFRVIKLFPKTFLLWFQLDTKLPSLPVWSSLIDSVCGTPVVHWGFCLSHSIKAQLFPLVLHASKHSHSPPICLVYWVFYLWENLYVPCVGDVSIYRFHRDFSSSSLQLNFCFVSFCCYWGEGGYFCYSVFFSFSDSIPLLLIPPPGMAHTAESPSSVYTPFKYL